MNERDYRASVGPAQLYDVLGASQCRLLWAMGLREHHRVLDFGCGSLRAGRLLIPYLQPDRYFGIEPDRRLVDQGFEYELGDDIRALKRPKFAYNDDFTVPWSGFDFVLAQSIFSHTNVAMTETAISSFAAVLASDGLVLATFAEGYRDHEGEWRGRELLLHRRDTIKRIAGDAGLRCRRLRWYHPFQTWYVMGPGALPRDPYLPGATRALEESWRALPRARYEVKRWLRSYLRGFRRGD